MCINKGVSSKVRNAHDRESSEKERERMSVCSSRCIILFILSLQLVCARTHTLCFRRRNVGFSWQITTLERGTFDGLGQLWSPLIADALNIIFVIVGMIGTRRFKAKAVVVVSLA